MEPNTIKYFYGNEWRRFAIVWPAENIYHHLAKEIKQQLRLEANKSVVLRYIDEDGDKVFFDSDTELRMAFQTARNGVLKVYAEDAPRNASDNQKWKRFSEQEKMMVRKGFSAVESVIEFKKPNPTFTLTEVKKGGRNDGQLLSFRSRSGPQSFTMTQQREGFGMNASTAEVLIKALSFGFEFYNTVTSDQ